MATQASLLGIAARPERSDLIARARLAEDLRQYWNEERTKWDAQVASDEIAGEDLWADMPAVDSKAVARMSPLFKRHMGRSLDVRSIRPGGYRSIEDVIQHLVSEDHGRG